MYPILYQSQDFILYSYPLLMGLGWGVGYQVFFDLMDGKLPWLKSQLLFWGIFLFSWLGAKVFFYLTLPDSLSQNLLTQMSFWTGGGFVFYGGLLAGALFLGIFRLLGNPLRAEILWPILPALCLGHAIGRIGCLLAGCCYGSPTEWWWGLWINHSHRHPTQLLEAIVLFSLGIFLLKSKQSRVLLFIYYLLIYGAARFLLEFLRGDEIRGSWGPLTPSQWISLAGISIAVLGLIYFKNKRLTQYLN